MVAGGELVRKNGRPFLRHCYLILWTGEAGFIHIQGNDLDIDSRVCRLEELLLGTQYIIYEKIKWLIND